MSDNTKTMRRDPVVLLHGLVQSPRSMRVLERALTRHGFPVINIGYPSRTASVAQLAKHVVRELELSTVERTHFVAHSLGGILVRAAVDHGLIPLERVGRVVMIGTPNRGAEIVDILGRWPVVNHALRWTTGPVGEELGIGPRSVPLSLPPVPFETGIIAGSRAMDALTFVVPRPNDGRITIEQCGVDGARDMVVVPHSHPYLMRAPVVVTLTIRFLETGSFRDNIPADVLG